MSDTVSISMNYLHIEGFHDCRIDYNAYLNSFIEDLSGGMYESWNGAAISLSKIMNYKECLSVCVGAFQLSGTEVRKTSGLEHQPARPPGCRPSNTISAEESMEDRVQFLCNFDTLNRLTRF